MKVLLDTNVILDVLQKREPWFAGGSRIFLTAAARQITACFTAKQAADIHFFSKRLFQGEENVDEKARQVISRLYAIFELSDTLAEDCRSALAIENGDYEDAVLIACAAREKMDFIITRDPEHFRVSPIPAVSPDAFADMLEK